MTYSTAPRSPARQGVRPPPRTGPGWTPSRRGG
jgi:hypothetical protein